MGQQRQADVDSQRVRKLAARQLLEPLARQAWLELSRCGQHFFDACDDALFTLADGAATNAEQNMYFESMRELRVGRTQFEQRVFREPLLHWVRGESLPPEPPLLDEVVGQRGDWQSLSLTVQLEAQLEALQAACERDQQRVSARWQTLFGHDVGSRLLPIGLESMTSRFVDLVGQWDLDAQTRLLCGRLFIEQLSGVLPALWQKLDQQLSEAGANLPDGFGLPERVTETAEAARPLSASALTRAQLLAQLPRLQQRQLSQLDGLAAEAALACLHSTPLGAWLVDEQGDELPLSLLDREIVSLVERLFAFIWSDHSCVDAMKVVLARLQIPVLRVALEDERFFSRRGHPARQLLNALADAALGWAPKSGHDDLGHTLRAIVDRVVREFTGDCQLFVTLLDELTSVRALEERQSVLQTRRTVEAERGRLQAEYCRLQAQERLEQLLQSHKQLPEAVRSLLLAGWLDVLVQSGIQHGLDSAAWQEQWQLTERLLWSVQPPIWVSRKQLIDALPELLRGVREGLTGAGYRASEVGEWMGNLEQIHLQVLQALVPGAQPAAVTEEQQVATVRESSSYPGQEQVQALAVGQWFELREAERDHPVRARLAAHIRQGDRFIFVNRSGLKVLEIVGQALGPKLEQGDIRALDDGLLFDRALESVIGNLRRMRE